MKMFWKILDIILNLISLSNILYVFLFLVSFLLIVAIFLQKNSEDFSEQKNLFGPNVRAETPVTITYYLISIFVFIILTLNVVIQKEYDKTAFSKNNAFKKYKIENKITEEKELQNEVKNYTIKKITKIKRKK